MYSYWFQESIKQASVQYSSSGNYVNSARLKEDSSPSESDSMILTHFLGFESVSDEPLEFIFSHYG